MNFTITETELRARALTDLRMGVPVVMQGYIICAAETLTDERLDQLRRYGDVICALTDWRARVLNIPVYDGDVARIHVSKLDKANWVAAVANPTLDMTHPMKGPFAPMRDGGADVAKQAITLCKAAHLLPAAVMVKTDQEFAHLTTIDDLGGLHPSAMQGVAAAALPLAVSSASKLHIFRPDDGGEEHYAIEIGTPRRDTPVLTRLHSACFTGDVLGSLKCDCGPQLNAALAQMGAEQSGVLLYLNQEGRGIGLANKMRAYALQSQGFDTVEANHRLGFEDDERDFQIGAKILAKLGFSQVRLLTNNPAKVQKLSAMGITVSQRVPLKVGQTRHNHAYLRTKAEKSGHKL